MAHMGAAAGTKKLQVHRNSMLQIIVNLISIYVNLIFLSYVREAVDVA